MNTTASFSVGDPGGPAIIALPSYSWASPSAPPLPAPPPSPAATKRLPAGPTASQAVEECLRTKSAAGCRRTYLYQLRWYLGTFAKHFGDTPIAEITLSDIEGWLARQPACIGVIATERKKLSSLFSFAIRKGWLSANPIKRLEPLRIDRTPPVILTPAQAETLLRATLERFPGYLAYLVLGLFVGLRPEEARQTHWNNIHLGERIVIVDGATSKVRRRRVVRMHDAAHAWFCQCPKREGPACPSKMSIQRYRLAVGQLVGGWSHDLLRHTAASYMLAAFHDVARVAAELGNSPGILLTHYKELVRPADAERFWKIRP